MRGAQAYNRTRNETASKERLMGLLFEKALSLIRSGAADLDAGRREDGFRALTRANDIVTELSATLDVARSPELGELLKDVYLFVTGRLVKAIATGDAALAREAERVFSPVADGFITAVAQVLGQAEARP